VCAVTFPATINLNVTPIQKYRVVMSAAPIVISLVAMRAHVAPRGAIQRVLSARKKAAVPFSHREKVPRRGG